MGRLCNLSGGPAAATPKPMLSTASNSWTKREAELGHTPQASDSEFGASWRNPNLRQILEVSMPPVKAITSKGNIKSRREGESYTETLRSGPNLAEPFRVKKIWLSREVSSASTLPVLRKVHFYLPDIMPSEEGFSGRATVKGLVPSETRHNTDFDPWRLSDVQPLSSINQKPDRATRCPLRFHVLRDKLGARRAGGYIWMNHISWVLNHPSTDVGCDI